jgi:hypothetical protein
MNFCPCQIRGKAALQLYEQTAILFKEIIPGHHREVIDHTLQLIKENIHE